LTEEDKIMAHATAAREFSQTDFPEYSTSSEASASAVSWTAVFAGAFASAALFLILVTLGAGMGLSSVSPWPSAGLAAATVSKGAIIWLILAEIIASAMGGYLAGRLRTKWVAIHTHEVYFRDTAHGFLMWSVGLVITVAFLASATTSMVAGTARNSPTVADEGLTAGSNRYFVDSLFRSNRPNADPNDAVLRTEAGVILANALGQPDLPAQDRTYLARLIASRTGISQSEAEMRVSNTVTAARESAEEARKAIAHSLYWMFVAFLIGAFCASYAATIGGKQRDHIPV
jgi:hypothetical protein